MGKISLYLVLPLGPMRQVEILKGTQCKKKARAKKVQKQLPIKTSFIDVILELMSSATL